ELVRIHEHLAQHAIGVFRLERHGSLERAERSVDAGKRRRGHLQVKVRALVRDDIAQGFLEIEHPTSGSAQVPNLLRTEGMLGQVSFAGPATTRPAKRPS